jgi:hypothetical protein
MLSVAAAPGTRRTKGVAFFFMEGDMPKFTEAWDAYLLVAGMYLAGGLLFYGLFA